MIKREIFPKLEKEFNKKEITALIGARQVGKTTLLKELFNQVKTKAIYLTFDKVEVLNLFDNDIETFIKQYISPYEVIFIDEIQYSRKSGKYLKYIFDEYKKKIFISGSSTPELSIKTLSYLVGRIRIFEIYGISFKEFINFKDKTKFPLLESKTSQEGLKQLSNLFKEYLLFGSYPKIVNESEISEKKFILKDIINTYLLKEIREILQFENSYQFELLLKRMSLADGTLINYSNISRDTEINLNKLKEMLSILEKTFIIKKLNPYLNNKIKELIKSPKTYYLDLGFKNSLIDNFSQIDFRLDKGEIYENFILKAFIQNSLKVSFWNYKNEYEVDFVLEKDGVINGFEVKSKLSKAKITTSMKKFIEICKPKKLYVFNESIDEITKYENTDIIFTNYLNIFSIIDGFK